MILFFVGVIVGLPAAAADGGSDPYAIWWSPSLELDSLDQIEARLERLLWPDHPEWRLEVRVSESSAAQQRDEIARSCADLLRMERALGVDIDPLKPSLWIRHRARCRALEHLGEAAPARESFVRDFGLNGAAIDVLPVLIEPGYVCGVMCALHDLNEKGMSWRDYWVGEHEDFMQSGLRFLVTDADLKENVFRFDVRSDQQMDVETIAAWMRIHILARADFTGDGVEDLLVLVDHELKLARRSGSALHVLTRDAAGDVLRVIDPEGYLCPTSQHVCD